MAEPQEPRACANAAQAAEWDGPAGAHRIRYAAVFDAEARPHNERFRAATGVAPADRVLDIGCGTGQSTRDAARAAVAGRALGIDLSADMLDHARQVSRAEGLRNISFEQADAQVHAFPAGGFDVAISRFGSMFFADPADRHVEAAGRECMHLGVGLLEADVAQSLLAADPPGVTEHGRGQVDAEHPARHGGTGRVPGGLTGAAADIEHMVGRGHAGRGAEPLVVRARLGVEDRGVLDPVRAGRPVPLRGLGRVGTRPGLLRYGHVRVLSQAACQRR